MIPGIPEGAAGSHLFDYLLRFFSLVSRFRQVCPPPLHLLSFVFFIQPALPPGLHPISLHSILSGLLPIAPSPFPLSYPYSFHHYPSPLYLLLFLFLFYHIPPSSSPLYPGTGSPIQCCSLLSHSLPMRRRPHATKGQQLGKMDKLGDMTSE